MKLYFCFAVIFICLLSCSPKVEIKKKIIKIDIKDRSNKDLPELKIKSVIRLEKNDLSLFGGIMDIEYYSNKIYLLDMASSRSVFVFNDKGNFINKTRFGRGPDELTNPFALFIDKKSKNVLVWDQALSEIFKYDLDLKFISKEKYEGIPFIDFAQIDKNKMLVRSHYTGDFAYILYEGNTKTYKNKFVKDLKFSGAIGLFRAISIGDHHTLLINSFDYNIYEYLNENVSSLYYFDFGKYGITKEEVEKKGNNWVYNAIITGKRVSSINEIAQTNSYLLFHVYNRDEAFYYIYSFLKGKTYLLNGYFEKGILPKCKIRGAVKNDIFYATVEPKDLLEYQNKYNTELVSGKIDLQDNPYIITFSIDKKK